LATFCSETSGCANGFSSVSGLTLRPDGHFLGTTLSNSFIEDGFGTIFDISQTGSLTTLFTFTGDVNGGFSQSPPIVGPDGAFYGVTSSGNLSCGTIYRLTTTLTTIHAFARAAEKQNGCSPYGALVLGTDGSFYGTAPFNGPNGYGVVFKVTYRPGRSTLFSVLASFDSTTGPPVGALVEGNDGNFYGVTNANFYSETGVTDEYGTVYKVTPAGELTVVHALNGTTDGADPVAGLILGSDGNLYGTAQVGGTARAGTLFQVTTSGGFTATSLSLDGYLATNIVQHTNGLIYGITNEGGPNDGYPCYVCGCEYNAGCGIVYSWNGSLPPFALPVQSAGAVGSTVEILGQGFTSTTTVSFNGTAAAATIQAGTSLWTTVPSGATTGPITVTTSTGTLTSNRPFVVVP
jgi:uncharacterized repeat protein (TIGR03803 family)